MSGESRDNGVSEPPPSLLSGVLQQIERWFAAGPSRRWVRRFCARMAAHRTGTAASAMAFNLFLAAIPMLAFVGWFIGTLLRDSPTALRAISPLLALTPNDAHSLIRRQIGRYAGSAVAPVALMGSVWLASSAFHTLMGVFEVASQARPRPWYAKRLIAIACVLVAVVGMAANGYLVMLVIGGPKALIAFVAPQYVRRAPKLWHWLAIGVPVATFTALLAAFFRIAVVRPGVRRQVWPGAAFTAAVGVFASAAFALYARTLARFTLFYGSLAAVAIMLAWIWLWCWALLVGAELNAVLEEQSAAQPPSVASPTQTPQFDGRSAAD